MIEDPLGNCQIFGGSSMRHISKKAVERFAEESGKPLFLVFNYDPELLPDDWEEYVRVDDVALLDVPPADWGKDFGDEIFRRVRECQIFKIGKATVSLSCFYAVSGNENLEKEVIEQAREMLGRENFTLIHNRSYKIPTPVVLKGKEVQFTNKTTRSLMYLTVCKI